jgi:MFS family permease
LHTDILVISEYFEKRRAFATGLVTAGSGIGQIAVPPVVNWLINQFGWRAALQYQALAYAAIVISSSLAFRPARHHTARKDQSKNADRGDATDPTKDTTPLLPSRPPKTFWQLVRDRRMFLLICRTTLVALGYWIPSIYIVCWFELLCSYCLHFIV